MVILYRNAKEKFIHYCTHAIFYFILRLNLPIAITFTEAIKGNKHKNRSLQVGIYVWKKEIHKLLSKKWTKYFFIREWQNPFTDASYFWLKPLTSDVVNIILTSMNTTLYRNTFICRKNISLKKVFIVTAINAYLMC